LNLIVNAFETEYLRIIVWNDRNQNNGNSDSSEDEEDEEEEEEEDGKPPTPPPRSDSLTRSFDNSSSPPTVDEASDGSGDELPAQNASVAADDKANDETEVRRRQREDRKRATEDLINSIKTKQKEAEEHQRKMASVKDLVPKCLFGVAVAGIIALFSYKYWT
jgi:hypothetical protein